MKESNKLNIKRKQWSKPSVITTTKESMMNRIRLSACSRYSHICLNAFAR